MNDAKPPVNVSEIIQLTKLGIPLQQVTWSRVTMTSDSHICIRYEQNDGLNRNGVKGQLMVVSLKEDGYPNKKWPMSPESAKVSPSPCSNGNYPFVAIKTGDMIMVLQMERSRDVVAKCRLPDVSYWTWLNPTTLALITEKHVFHWNITKKVIPERVFIRHQRLTFAEIINYTADSSLNWLAITGLLPQEDNISGVTQLYCMETGLTQCIGAHTVTLFHYTFDGNMWPSTVLAVASRDSASSSHGKIHVIELGPHKEGNLAPVSYSDQIKFQDTDSKYDFPVAIQVSKLYCLMYILSKYGHMYISDLENATFLYSTSISPTIVFVSALHTSTQGLVAVCRSGKVLHVRVKLEELAQYMRQVLRKPSLAQRLELMANKLKCTSSVPTSV